MEVSSPQLAQAVAAARVALAEAFVLKVGQTLQALVVGKGGDGLSLLKIGEQTVKAALPDGLPTGTTLQLQVKSVGPSPQLAILAQSLPTGKAGVPAVPAEPRLPAPLPVRAAPMVAERAVAPSNGEVRPAVGPTASQVESRPTEGTRPAPEARSALPEAQATGRGPTQAPIATPASTSAAPAVAARAASPEAREPPRGTAAAAEPTPAPRALPGEARGSIGVPQAEAAAVRTAAPPLPTAVTTASQPAVAPGPTSPTPAPTLAAPSSEPIAGDARPAAPPPAAAGGSAAPASSAVEPELVHPLLVAQTAPRPQASVAELPRGAVASPPAPPVSAAVQAQLPATPQAALSQMLPEALARQDSAGPLLQSLAMLVQKPAVLPEPVLRAALGVLAQRVVATSGKVQAVDLERAVLRSGLGLEAALAKGEAPVPMDAKVGLLTLRAALAKWLGEPAGAAVPQRDAAPPPLKGLPLRAPDREPALPPLPDAPRDAVRAVHGQADAAVSRLKLMQLASLPDADPGRPAPTALRLELPLMIGHELVMAQLQVSRDGSRREAERKRGWTMRFALNYSATGEVGAEVGLLGKAVNVALWAAEPETAAAMQAALPELGGALEAIGLKPGALRIRHGVPEPERPVSGQLVDSVS